MRFWLAMGLGIMLLFCLGGVGVFVSQYDKETKIDRAAPDQVTSSFLRAYLIDRDDAEAALYTCKSGADLQTIADLRTELVSREKKFGTTVSVSWAALTVSGSETDQKSVAVNLIIAGWSGGQQVSSHEEPWIFSDMDQNGWRVCGAKKAM